MNCGSAEWRVSFRRALLLVLRFIHAPADCMRVIRNKGNKGDA